MWWPVMAVAPLSGKFYSVSVVFVLEVQSNLFIQPTQHLPISFLINPICYSYLEQMLLLQILEK